ncbi:hypothetical protein MRB53_005847 [Persea americana]|uniref:Uncharacterized protein n=1 Tax=Persea americana TaxID=3435 RepID=A0ACC2MFH0_PERAE|nr:hypothetical protein MRB53_005847 [Persea americana]
MFSFARVQVLLNVASSSPRTLTVEQEGDSGSAPVLEVLPKVQGIQNLQVSQETLFPSANSMTAQHLFAISLYHPHAN